MALNERVNQKLARLSELNRETEKVVTGQTTKIGRLMQHGADLEGIDLTAMRKRYGGFMEHIERIEEARRQPSINETEIERMLDIALKVGEDILRDLRAVDTVLDQRMRSV
jgi:hypothetical protein